MGKSVQVHKPHKTRFASKSTRNIHRVSQTDKARISKEQKNVGKGARAARIQRNKMARDQKRAALLKLKRATSGGSTPPRVIVLFGLSDEVNLGLLREDILKLLAPTGTKSGSCTVASSDFRIRTTILEAPHGDLLSCMEMAKVADLIVFVSSGNSVLQSSDTSGFVDSFACHCLSVMRTVGFPSTAVFMRDLPADLKGRQDFKKACISCLTSEVPEECKFYFADSKDDLNKFLRIFKEQHLTIPHWRANRPYILSDEVKTENDNDDMGKCHLVLSGYLRAHSLSVNQLVHVSGAGDFQLSKIEVLNDPYPMNYRPNSNSMESDESNHTQILRTLLPDISKLEPLLVENVYDSLVGEQTWPTEEEMLEAENANKGKKLKKKVLPQGTSDYQAAWIVDETDDENSDIDEDEDDGMLLDIEKNEQSVEDVSDADDLISMKDVDEQTETDTVMADDENLTREQIEEEIQRLKEAHTEEEEFPDEVDTPLDVPAKRRFAKYRGLKSFRTSSWDPKESLPPEYARIFAFDNFIRTQKHALAKVRETDQSNADQSVSVGSYVKLYFKQVPLDMASKVCSASNNFPVVASGLLQHESKMSVLHFSIKKHESYDLPIKSKESLVFHVGFRQFVARPIFSSDNLKSDKHKMERFLLPGCFSVASIYAPISFPPLPMIALKCKQGSQPVLAATGSLKIVDPDRIILKKIILTGYPQRVSKLKATVRFMFHNPDDVRWFKPVDLWTKRGRRGRVMDSVGTHGAMKCVFDGVVQQHDTVCMSLYKRIYPKWPESCYAVGDRYF